MELDIITLVCNELHIIEVKTRSAGARVPPEINVNAAKRRHMVAAAGAFLNSPARSRLPSDLEVFFDILTVVFQEPEPLIEYYPRAFLPLYY